MDRAARKEQVRVFKQGLEHHLRDTLEQFGQAIEAQAEDCREELAYALADTGRRLTSSVTMLRKRLRDRAGQLEEGAAKATSDVGRDLMQVGKRLSPRAQARAMSGGGMERSQHRVPGSHVEITATFLKTELAGPQSEFVHPEPEPEEQVPPEGRHPRDSQAA